MSLKKLLITLLFGVTLSGTFIQSMDISSGDHQIYRVDPTFSGSESILQVLENYFILTEVPAANVQSNHSDTETEVHYQCIPKEDFEFTYIINQLYTAAYGDAYKVLSKQVEVHSNCNQSLYNLNIGLTNRLHGKYYTEYLKYFGAAFVGAGVMGLGIYCYVLLKK